MPTRLLAASLLAAATLLPAQTSATPSPADPHNPANAGRLQLNNYLDTIAARNTEARRTAVAAITTRAQAEARQTKVRNQILSLIGPLPQKTPLNAQVMGATQAEGFRIEKILFYSQPNFPVTALLYLPDNPQNKKLPAILIAPGHGRTGKTSDYPFASTFARNGFAVLSYDPLGQGERLQYPDPAHPDTSLARQPTGEHGEAGLQPVLIGEAIAKYFLWDAIRGIDYLTSRPEIDPTRIGAFGCSGGGVMTALVAALDPRVATAGVACYITSFDTLLPAIGPQDGEQSIPGFLTAGPSGPSLDFPDWIELAAPRPYAIISTTSDMFPFSGAQKSEAEARGFYKLFNADQNLAFLTGPGGHGNLRPIAPQILSFFVQHLQPGADLTKLIPYPPAPNPGNSVPPQATTNNQTPNNPSASSNSPGAPSLAVSSPRVGGTPPGLPPDAFQVTPTGQVATSYPNSETVFSLNLKHATQLLPHAPKNLTLTQTQQAVREVTHASAVPGALGTRGNTDRVEMKQGTLEATYQRNWLFLHSEEAPRIVSPIGVALFPDMNGIRNRAVITYPKAPGKHPGVLLLAGSVLPAPDPTLFDRQTYDRQSQLTQGGDVVLILAPRPSPPGTEEIKAPIMGDFYLTGLRAELVGKTILGMRVDDIIRAVDYLVTRPDVDPNNITAQASGHMGLALLHAAALDPRLKHITVDHTLASYDSLLKAPLPRNAPEDILPGVLLHYDIDNLTRTLGPRLTLTNPLHGTEDLAAH